MESPYLLSGRPLVALLLPKKRGGARPGAGRPKGSLRAKPKPQRQRAACQRRPKACAHVKPILKNGRERKVCFECWPKSTKTDVSDRACIDCAKRICAIAVRCRACARTQVEKTRRKVGRDCAWCAAPFLAWGHAKYCTQDCHDAAYAGRTRKPAWTCACEACEKLFETNNPRGKWCSRRCHNKVRSAWRRAKTKGAQVERVSPLRVFERDAWTCRGCGCHSPRLLMGTRADNEPCLDHVVALSRGGAHTYENVQLLCRVCNTLKGADSMAEFTQRWLGCGASA